MRKRVPIGLINYHFSQGVTRPYVPGMIEVGGLQIKDPPSPLPDNIQTWLDGAKHGVIYMSMGSNIKSSSLSPSVLSAIMTTFSKLKERIIWKFENDSIPNIPENIMISKWLPQSDLLAHPNLRLFITHGGLGSMIEARFHGVPLVGIPIFADQMANLNLAYDEGYAEILNYNDLTQESFKKILNKVLKESKYMKKAQIISKLFRDRPKSSMETAVYWVEYVIRHNGAKHIQAKSIHYNLLQLSSVDVIAFLITILFIITFILFKSSKYCIIFIHKLAYQKKSKIK